MLRSRNPDIRRVRTSTTYSVLEITRLLDVHENTVRRWLGAGLKMMDEAKPILVHGVELKRFLSERRVARKQKCAPDEFHCLRCRAPRAPVTGSVFVAAQNQKTVRLRGTCCVCGSCMWRAGSLAKLTEYALTFGFPAKATSRLKGEGFPLVNGDLKEDEDDGQNQHKE